MFFPDEILDSRKFTDETYILLSRRYEVIAQDKLNDGRFRGIQLRERPAKLLGITGSAAKKAIALSKDESEPSEKKTPLGSSSQVP